LYKLLINSWLLRREF